MAYGDGEPWCSHCHGYGHVKGCPEYPERGWLSRVIEDAQKSLDARPRWKKIIEHEQRKQPPQGGSSE